MNEIVDKKSDSEAGLRISVQGAGCMEGREEGRAQTEGRRLLKKGLRMELEMDALTHARGTRTGDMDRAGRGRFLEGFQ